MPTIFRGPFTSLPATSMLPALGRRNPVTSFISDDLPQPDGPTTATNFPWSISRSSPSMASVGRRRPYTSRTSRICNRVLIDALPSRNVADDVERELTLVAAPRDLDNGLIEADREILLQPGPALRRRPGCGEDVGGLRRQQPHGAIEIVAGMRLHDRLVVDIEVRRLDVVGVTAAAEQECELAQHRGLCGCAVARDVAVDEGAFSQCRGIASLGRGACCREF